MIQIIHLVLILLLVEVLEWCYKNLKFYIKSIIKALFEAIDHSKLVLVVEIIRVSSTYEN